MFGNLFVFAFIRYTVCPWKCQHFIMVLIFYKCSKQWFYDENNNHHHNDDHQDHHQHHQYLNALGIEGLSIITCALMASTAGFRNYLSRSSFWIFERGYLNGAFCIFMTYFVFVVVYFVFWMVFFYICCLVFWLMYFVFGLGIWYFGWCIWFHYCNYSVITCQWVSYEYLIH